MSGERTGGEPADGRPLVLIVDHNQDVGSILDSLLEREGFESASTDDPDEALRWALSRSPAVIIGEHPLQLSDGRILCAALMEDSRTTGIPFVAVTARAFPEDLRDACETHPHGVFSKPVEPGRIFEHINALVSP